MNSHWQSAGLLLLRTGTAGLMLAGHGIELFQRFTTLRAQPPHAFYPVNGTALGLIGLIEVVCGVLMIIGLGTRIAAGVFAFTLLCVAFFAHGDAALFSSMKEAAILYAIPAVALAFTGAGGFSLDGLIHRRMQRSDRTRPGKKFEPVPFDDVYDKMKKIGSDGTIMMWVLFISLPIPIVGPVLLIAVLVRLGDWQRIVKRSPDLAKLIAMKPSPDPDISAFKRARIVFLITIFLWIGVALTVGIGVLIHSLQQ